MPLKATCPDCGHVSTISADRADLTNYCPKCDERLPKPSGGSSSGLVIAIVLGVVFLLVLVPAALLAFWFMGAEAPKPAAQAPIRAPIEVAQPPVAVPALEPIAPQPPKPKPKPRPPEIDTGLPANVLAKLKASTVLVVANTPFKENMGAGFVFRQAGGQTYVLTTHRVLTDQNNVRAGSCAVIVRSGLQDEKATSAKVVSSIPELDIAILSVQGVGEIPNFPQPLESEASNEPRDVASVVQFGLPEPADWRSYGDSNPIAIPFKSNLAGRRDGDESVRIEGDLRSGTAGGPVVDSRGKLLGIAVGQGPMSNQNAMIPIAEINSLLRGRLADFAFRERGRGGQSIQWVVFSLFDPFEQIKSAAIVVAPTDESAPTKKSGADWPAIKGERHLVKVENQFGSIQLPFEGSGRRRYSFQVVLIDSAGKERLEKPIVKEIDLGEEAPKKSTPAPKLETTSRDVNGAKVVSTLIAGRLEDFRRLLPTPPCLCWSEDAKSIYALDSTANIVRRLSFPELKEEAQFAVESRFTWISPCQDGLLVTAIEKREAWILDSKTLKKKSGFVVAGALETVSNRNTPYAYAATGAGGQANLVVYDTRTGQAASQQLISAKCDVTGRLALSPDAKRLYTITTDSEMQSFELDGEKVRPASKTARLLDGNSVGICLSPDGQFICAPSGGGNVVPVAKGTGEYKMGITLIFKTNDLGQPGREFKTGAISVIGFNPKSNEMYVPHTDEQLIVYAADGTRRTGYAIEPGNTWVIKQFLPHPDGRRLAVLADDYRRVGVRLISVELPPAK